MLAPSLFVCYTDYLLFLGLDSPVALHQTFVLSLPFLSTITDCVGKECQHTLSSADLNFLTAVNLYIHNAVRQQQ